MLVYGFRYLDPVHGRWLNRDPMEEEGHLRALIMEWKAAGKADINPYRFVFGNPLGYYDIDGRGSGGMMARALPFAGQAAAADAVLPVGDAIGLVAIVAAGVWDQTQPGPGTGNCTTYYHRFLQNVVDGAKAYAGFMGRCKPRDCCWLLKLKKHAWLSLAIARSKINVSCFNGGDANHQQKAAEAWRNVGRCAEYIENSCE